MNFPEEFLHYVWQFRSFNYQHLKTASGDDLTILHPGFLNKDAAHDFSHAKIKIGKTIWAGNIEIHIRFSDWLKHNHQSDRSYENVILHVVYENDVDIKRIDGSILPILILTDRLRMN